MFMYMHMAIVLIFNKHQLSLNLMLLFYKKEKRNAHNFNLFATAYVSTDYLRSTNVKESDCVSYILIKGHICHRTK